MEINQPAIGQLDPFKATRGSQTVCVTFTSHSSMTESDWSEEGVRSFHIAAQVVPAVMGECVV